MKVFVGIDVGGTFTDYAAVADGKLILGGKVPNQGNYIASFQNCLDIILQKVAIKSIYRLNISTTAITNYIATEKYNFPETILMPGPGIDPNTLPIPKNYILLDAAMDFRGREIKPLSTADKAILDACKAENYAIVGKFSNRNAKHELQVEDYLQENIENQAIVLGHTVSSELGFPRRVNTTLFYAVTKEPFSSFIGRIKAILSIYNLESKAFFLTSNGALYPLDYPHINPSETVQSGPVGSILGAKALLPHDSFVTLDIGGTTTDLGLVLDNTPVFSDKGIALNGYPTAIPSFAVYSIPLGGDLPVDEHSGILMSQRKGPAIAFGGKWPTLTDALNVLDILQVGDFTLSKKNLKQKNAKKAVENALDILTTAFSEILTLWYAEKAYHLWEMKQPEQKPPRYLIGLGGGALGLTDQLAALLNMQAIYPKHYQIANAIGTALAKSTITASLHVDTAQKKCQYIEIGSSLSNVPDSLEKLHVIASNLVADKYKEFFSEEEVPEIKFIQSEQFNVVRGFSTTGKIFYTKAIIPADVYYKVVE